METILLSEITEIPNRRAINQLIQQEIDDRLIIFAIVTESLPADLTRLILAFFFPIPQMLLPGISPLSYDEHGYKDFLFEFTRWWFQCPSPSLLQFLEVAKACHWMIYEQLNHDHDDSSRLVVYKSLVRESRKDLFQFRRYWGSEYVVFSPTKTFLRPYNYFIHFTPSKPWILTLDRTHEGRCHVLETYISSLEHLQALLLESLRELSLRSCA